MAVEETETQMKSAINQKLIELGEKERLKSLPQERLAECGWQEQMKEQCRKTVKERGADITVDDLVTEITPRGRALVPDEVKRELLQKIKHFLADQANL